MQLVIADTGPINYLLLIGHIDILPALFEKVILPADSLTELGAGETAAIALAVELHADLLLMDDRRGVSAALQRGLTVTVTQRSIGHGVACNSGSGGFVSVSASPRTDRGSTNGDSSAGGLHRLPEHSAQRYKRALVPFVDHGIDLLPTPGSDWGDPTRRQNRRGPFLPVTDFQNLYLLFSQ